jgi:hypothetical protein
MPQDPGVTPPVINSARGPGRPGSARAPAPAAARDSAQGAGRRGHAARSLATDRATSTVTPFRVVRVVGPGFPGCSAQWRVHGRPGILEDRRRVPSESATQIPGQAAGRWRFNGLSAGGQAGLSAGEENENAARRPARQRVTQTHSESERNLTVAGPHSRQLPATPPAP